MSKSLCKVEVGWVTLFKEFGQFTVESGIAKTTMTHIQVVRYSCIHDHSSKYIHLIQHIHLFAEHSSFSVHSSLCSYILLITAHSPPSFVRPGFSPVNAFGHNGSAHLLYPAVRTPIFGSLPDVVFRWNPPSEHSTIKRIDCEFDRLARGMSGNTPWLLQHGGGKTAWIRKRSSSPRGTC